MLEKTVADTFGHASQYSYNERVVHAAVLRTFGPLVLYTLEELQSAIYLLFGIITHRTSVHKDGVSIVDVFAQLVANGLHDAGHNLAICYIHLTTVGLYE